MKKTKIFSVLLAIIMLITTFSACNGGTVNKNDIVGQWYDANGEMKIDVRADGSYDDDGYGTGTWKYLDDGVTIEFMDFYGSTKTTTIVKDEYGYSIFDGRYYKDAYPNFEKDENEISTNESTETVSIPLSKVSNFSDGCAWVEYNKDGVDYNGLINTKGELLFSIEKSDTLEKTFSIENGLGCFFRYPNNYSLINAKGEIVASAENDDFDFVLAYGDGMALVYKKQADISTVKHLYGVIDKNGRWLQPLTNWEVEPSFSKTGGELPLSFYAEENMFVVRTKNSYSDVYIVYNAQTAEKMYLYDIRSEVIKSGIFKFSNGQAVVGNAHEHDVSYMSKKFVNETNKAGYYDRPDYIIPLPDNFILYSDGRFKEIDEFDDISNNIVMRKTNNVWNLYDVKKNKTYTFAEYSAQNTKVDFVGEYGFIRIKGVDNKSYFTIIDGKTGLRTFDPICYTNVYCSKEGIVYRNTENNDFYRFINFKGEVVADNLDYEIMSYFSEGFATIKYGNDNYAYINTKGEIVLTGINV